MWMMIVKANKDACIGSGQCVLLCPSVFAQDEDTGIVEIKQVNPPAELREAVTYAVSQCPTQALTILDAGSE